MTSNSGRKCYKLHWAGMDEHYVQEYTCMDGAEMLIGPILYKGDWATCRKFLDNLLAENANSFAYGE